MNKKGQAAMEFLMTYGWAILVVLLCIGALAYFGVLDPRKYIPEEVNESSPQFVCEHLQKMVDGEPVIYHAIVTSKYDLEDRLGLKAEGIYGESSQAIQWDEEGVICGMDVDMCEVLFCLNVQMMIPVNYTEWEKWR